MRPTLIYNRSQQKRNSFLTSQPHNMATDVSWIYEGQLQLTLHLTWFRDGNFLVTVNLNSLVILLHIYLVKILFQTESWTPLPVWPWGSFPPLWSGLTMSLLVNLVNLFYIEMSMIILDNFQDTPTWRPNRSCSTLTMASGFTRGAAWRTALHTTSASASSSSGAPSGPRPSTAWPSPRDRLLPCDP